MVDGVASSSALGIDGQRSSILGARSDLRDHWSQFEAMLTKSIEQSEQKAAEWAMEARNGRADKETTQAAAAQKATLEKEAQAETARMDGVEATKLRLQLEGDIRELKRGLQQAKSMTAKRLRKLPLEVGTLNEDQVQKEKPEADAEAPGAQPSLIEQEQQEQEDDLDTIPY